ncbi:hypothetical protein CsSME_00018436 [Camellia sinensis var. sinensis]
MCLKFLQFQYQAIYAINNRQANKETQKIVREIPLLDSAGVLTIINPGSLALVHGTGNVIWSPNMTGSTWDPVAQLMESGNLVVRDANDQSGHFLWQSFDYPCDTLLPGMKLGKNFVTGLERHLSSWKSSDDPAPGEFTYRCDPQGYPQNILSRGSVELYRTGPWNGIGFSGRPNLKPNTIYKYEVVYTKEEVKFVPRNQTEWGNGDWSYGCDRRTPLDCHNGDGFIKHSGYKLPDPRNSWFDRNMTLGECEMVCLKNCSFMMIFDLYAQSDTASFFAMDVGLEAELCREGRGP